MRRRFSDRERVALYLASDGQCESCGVELDEGWHADHVQPFSRGGATDVVNGAALCPRCNLRKGNRMKEEHVDPRSKWQENAIREFLKTDRDFLVTATPGAGKTKMALQAAKRLIEKGVVERIIVVVPTDNLRGQWSENAHLEGLDLTGDYRNGTASLRAAKHGVVTTYQTVCANPELWRKHASVPTLAIFDEIHHAGDESTWGTSLKYAFGHARRRLMLSGTPFRTDKSPIPFVEYDENGLSKSHGGINMRDAVMHEVIRSVRFEVLNGEGGWIENGATHSAWISEASESDRKHVWRSMRKPENDWIPTTFVLANEELNRFRIEMPRAAGIVYASNIFNAERYAEIMSQICGESVDVVHSEIGNDANDVIKRFADGSKRWLVSVKMVSEGVDIPRAIVGVYASDICTEMWFRQVVGRHVRRMDGDGNQTATVFIPQHPELCEIAYRVEQEANVPLREREISTTHDMFDNFDGGLSSVESLWASAAKLAHVVHQGETFDAAEISKAQRLLDESGINNLHAADLVRLAKKYSQETDRPVMELQSQSAPKRMLTPDQERKKLREQLNGLVGKCRAMTGFEYDEINKRLFREFGVRRPEADIECLHRQIIYVKEMIAAGREQLAGDSSWR